MDDPTLTSITTVVQLINAGGVVAVLIILVGGFWTGKIMSRKTHDEIAEKQTLIVDRFVEKINGSFGTQSERIEVIFNDYINWKDEWRVGLDIVGAELKSANDEQTAILTSIDTQLKRANNK